MPGATIPISLLPPDRFSSQNTREHHYRHPHPQRAIMAIALRGQHGEVTGDPNRDAGVIR